jgi:hypothetical protein
VNSQLVTGMGDDQGRARDRFPRRVVRSGVRLDSQQLIL